MVLAMSAWDVRKAPPTDKPGVMVRLYLPDMRRSLSHSTSHDVCLASRMTGWALEWKRLKDIRLSNVGWARNCVKTRSWNRIAYCHSSVHHGAGVWRGTVDDRRLHCSAARSTVLVKHCTMVHRREVLVLRVQGLTETSPVGTSGVSLRCTGHPCGWCSHARVYRAVGQNWPVKVDCYTGSTRGKVQGRQGSWLQAKCVWVPVFRGIKSKSAHTS
jgi:hypothetical protein